MSIHGLNKLTLLDYPGKLAATIFLGNCNFQCLFCQNGDLVLCPSGQPVIETEEVLRFLKKRQGILEGVCITGGEPTLYEGLEELIRAIRELGYCVKLDTNGYKPEILKDLVKKGLLDMVAMDIKSDQDTYGLVSGRKEIRMEKICESVEFLMENHIPYEFRTTVVREFHNAETFEKIGQWISGCQGYYLQNYRDSDAVIQSGLHGYTIEELQVFKEILLKTIEKVEIRGID